MWKVRFGDEETKKAWVTGLTITGLALATLSAAVIAPLYWSHNRSKAAEMRKFELLRLVGQNPLEDAERAFSERNHRFYILVNGEVPGVADFHAKYVRKYGLEPLEGVMVDAVDDTVRRLHRRAITYASQYNRRLLELLEPPPPAPPAQAAPSKPSSGAGKPVEHGAKKP